MTTPFANAKRYALWNVQVMDRPSGAMELYETPGGFAWFWRDKPAHLVQLNGVPDDVSAQPNKPFCFGVFEDAIGHLMQCAGIAFYGRCALLEAA